LSRIQHVAVGAPTLNVTETALTVPAGHKFEVLTFSMSTDGTAAMTMQVFARILGGTKLIADELLAVGKRAALFNFNSVCLEAGDSFRYQFKTAGAPGGSAWVVTYMDVDLL